MTNALRIDILLGLAAAGFLLLLTWENNPVPAVGLWERLATGALSVWLIVFSRGWQWLDEDRHPPTSKTHCTNQPKAPAPPPIRTTLAR